MKEDFAELLDANLELLREGALPAEPPIQAVDERVYLAALLRTAAEIRALPRPGLSADAAARIERRLSRRTREIATSAGCWPRLLDSAATPATAPGAGARLLQRLIALAATVLLALAVLGAGSVLAADSWPASPLYGLKIAGEQARLMFAQGAAGRARVRILMAEHRLAELEAMIAAGRELHAAPVDALQQEIDSALAEIEAVPAPGVLPLLSRLNGIVARQKAVLQAVFLVASPDASARLDEAIGAADEAQRLATAALARTLREQVQINDLAGPSTAGATATSTAVPTSAVTPGVAALPAASATATARPRPATPDLESFEVEGRLQAINGGLWTIEGRRITVDNRTKIEGGLPRPGATVEVKVIALPDGTLRATAVEVVTPAAPDATRSPEATKSVSPLDSEPRAREVDDDERETESKAVTTPTPIAARPKAGTPLPTATRADARLATPTPAEEESEAEDD